MSAAAMAYEGASGKVLRVSLVTETYPPEINGVANTLGRLAQGLMQRGHGIHLVRPRQGRESSQQREGGILETRVPGLPIPGYPGLRFGLPVYWRLRRIWREAPPDAVYIATQGPLGQAALAAARANGVSTLTGFHTRFHQYSKHYGLGLFERRIISLLRRFHNRSDATLVPTEELRQELLNLGFRNVRVLGRGVDTELFDPRRRNDDLRRRWGCPPARKIALYVGRLAAEKNLDLVLQAFAGIASTTPDTRFVLVGDGPESARLRRSHPELILTGPKRGLDLAEHYASGDLFLFPSLTETFGNVVPEAMASGLPVVAFDYAAAGACVRTGENGIKVPRCDAKAFREAAVTAIGNEAALRAMGRSARIAAEGMSWSRVIGELEARLLEVTETNRTERRHENLAATTE